MTGIWIHLWTVKKCKLYNTYKMWTDLLPSVIKKVLNGKLLAVVSDCSWDVLPLCVEVICTLLSIDNCTVYPLFSSLNFVEVCKLLVSQLEESLIFVRLWFSETVLVMSIGDWLFPSHFSSTIPQCIGPKKLIKNHSSKTIFMILLVLHSRLGHAIYWECFVWWVVRKDLINFQIFFYNKLSNTNKHSTKYEVFR